MKRVTTNEKYLKQATEFKNKMTLLTPWTVLQFINKPYTDN